MSSNFVFQETINLLVKTFTLSDKYQRESAELRLKELENDIMSHFKFIMNAIKDGSLISSKNNCFKC